MKYLRDKKFIELITVLVLLIGICIIILIRIKDVEEYCKIEENRSKWNCITWGDLVGDKK